MLQKNVRPTEILISKPLKKTPKNKQEAHKGAYLSENRRFREKEVRRMCQKQKMMTEKTTGLGRRREEEIQKSGINQTDIPEIPVPPFGGVCTNEKPQKGVKVVLSVVF